MKISLFWLLAIASLQGLFTPAYSQERYISPRAFTDTIHTKDGLRFVSRLDAVYSRQVYFTIQNPSSNETPYRKDTLGISRIDHIQTSSEGTAKLLKEKGTIPFGYTASARSRQIHTELSVRVGPSFMLDKHGSSYFTANTWLERKLPVALQWDARLCVFGKGPWGAYALYSQRRSSGTVDEVSGYYTYHLVGVGARYRRRLMANGYWHIGTGAGVSHYQSKLSGAILPSATSYTYTHGGASADFSPALLAEAGAHLRLIKNLYAGLEGSLILGREDARGELNNGYGSIYTSPSSYGNILEPVSRIALSVSLSLQL